MQWSDISLAPPAKTLRQFAILCLGFFGSMALWQGLVRERYTLAAVLGVAAITIAGLGLTRPDGLRWLYVSWMVLAFPLGWFVSQFVLLTIFVVVFTPVAVLFRLLGRDALCRRFDPAAPTYWSPKPAPADPRNYLHQY